MKTIIVILSDPNSGTDESLGRVFNALAVAYDVQADGGEVGIIFQGAGTRWPAILQNKDHPANPLYKAIESYIVGVSSGCADVFAADPAGLDLIKDNPVPGTSGLPSLHRLNKAGAQTLIF